MKKFKKIVGSIMLGVLVFGLTGCGTENPKSAVETYFKEIKAGDENKNNLVNEAINKTSENIDEDSFSKETEEALSNLMKKTEYKINDEKIDGDIATVNVTVNGANLFKIITDTINQSMGKAVESMFSGKEMNDEELKKSLDSYLLENINKSKLEERTGNVTLDKSDKEWKIKENDELSELVLGAFSK
ncbi:MAG: hypothetical protein ACRCVJ_06990 [Clostridium sp.]|uniref:hypothetical protein n=1 Tax=Clostridium sp. TaxID=1506 RepID=UPI003F2EB6A8